LHPFKIIVRFCER